MLINAPEVMALITFRFKFATLGELKLLETPQILVFKMWTTRRLKQVGNTREYVYQG